MVIFELWKTSHSFAARNFAHLYVVGGRQHSMGAVAKMQRTVCIHLGLHEPSEGPDEHDHGIQDS